MRDKIIRLIKALSNETIKRIPYIIIVLLVLVFAQSIQNNKVAKNNSINEKSLLMKVAALSEDNKNLTIQNKQLTEQGVTLAAQAVNLNKCIAQAFALYTQTGRAVEFVDIDKCIIVSLSAKTMTTPEQSIVQPSKSNQSGSASGSSSNNNNSPTPAQSNNQQNQPPPKSLLTIPCINLGSLQIC